MMLKHRKTGIIIDGFEVWDNSVASLVYVTKQASQFKASLSSYGWVDRKDRFDPDDKNPGELEYEPLDWDEFENEITLYNLK